MENLKNFHINGIQFYDWQNKHHWPLKMNGAVAADSWVDIANREIQFSVLKKYIANNKSMGISSMFYNLLYGTWKDALADGVPADWYLYNNAAATDINKHPLSGWLSDIFLVNPGLKAWQDYLGQKTADVYQNLDFDGFHIDQLGDRGTLFSKQGTPVDLSQQFGSFIAAMKTKFPNKKLAMNAVNQYGQAGILSSPVDFAYTEVWSPNDSYSSLANIILNNYTTSPKLNTVIAAYMDYAKADQKGTFNEAGVLLTDAVLFAFGGSHIELGEHMLGKEYFPNNNLSMSASLKSKLTNYYDFLVGYQNILRDGGKLNYNPSVTSTDKILPWPGTSGYVTTFRRLLTSGTEVFHFINFRDANSMDWRDTNGTQIEPSVIRNYNLVINLTGAPKKVWAASPDVNGGAPIQVPFVQNGNTITLKLPSLKYWSMLVVEH